MSVSAGEGRDGLKVVGRLSLGLEAIFFGLFCKVLAVTFTFDELEVVGQLRAESRVVKVRLKQAPSGKSL